MTRSAADFCSQIIITVCQLSQKKGSSSNISAFQLPMLSVHQNVSMRWKCCEQSGISNEHGIWLSMAIAFTRAIWWPTQWHVSKCYVVEHTAIQHAFKCGLGIGLRFGWKVQFVKDSGKAEASAAGRAVGVNPMLRIVAVGVNQPTIRSNCCSPAC